LYLLQINDQKREGETLSKKGVAVVSVGGKTKRNGN